MHDQEDRDRDAARSVLAEALAALDVAVGTLVHRDGRDAADVETLLSAHIRERATRAVREREIERGDPNLAIASRHGDGIDAMSLCAELIGRGVTKLEAEAAIRRALIRNTVRLGPKLRLFAQPT